MNPLDRKLEDVPTAVQLPTAVLSLALASAGL